MPRLEIITTEDGSHTVLNQILNETYHSVHGAVQESQHVFIRHGFAHWTLANPGKEIRILEIGFGTGLNAFLTLHHSGRLGVNVYYESWEMFPLGADIVGQLNYPSVLGASELYSKIHEVSWNRSVVINPFFILHKRRADILLDPFDLVPAFDVVYYDAFAPSKQPEMWTLVVLEKVISTLGPGGIFVTYCARGQVKRDLTTLGLVVETLGGPPGKKEMIRASR